MAAPDFTGWLPIRLFWKQSHAWLDWCHLGDTRLTEPFFDHSIEKALQHPFNLAFRRQTPVEYLTELANSQANLSPNGFIFHMSRTGSTLVAQMLATLPENIVVSEASLIDAVFRPEVQYYGIDEAQQIAWLRGIISALGRPRRKEEKHFFIKFDSWHMVYLPLIQKAFPNVPWIFLYRNPVEVLVSLSREGGRQLVPGVINPAELGLDMAEIFQLPTEEYHARILARICEAALKYYQPGMTRFINYQELPGAVLTSLADQFRFNCSEMDCERMQERSKFGGKGPTARFHDDRAAKEQAASEAMRQTAALWLDLQYEEMERIRRGRDR